jgi:hypothetical protein
MPCTWKLWFMGNPFGERVERLESLKLATMVRSSRPAGETLIPIGLICVNA